MKTILVSVMPCLLVTIGLYAYTKNLKIPAVPNTQTVSVDKSNPAISIPQSNSLIADQVDPAFRAELTSNIAGTGVEPTLQTDDKNLVAHIKTETTEHQALPKKTTDSITWETVPVEP
jgi:hypothetical protein